MGYVRKEISAFTVDLLLFLAFQIGNKQLMFQALLLSQPGLLSPYTTYQVINKKGSQSSYQETEPGCFIPERQNVDYHRSRIPIGTVRHNTTYFKKIFSRG